MSNKKRDFPLKDYYKEIYTRYDLVNRVFTFGQDNNWRKKVVTECLINKPGRVLDVCTGTGDLILSIAKNSSSKLYLAGYDFSAEMLEKAKEKAKKGEGQLDFIEGDVVAMPFEDNYFDSAGISFGIRNLVYRNSNATQHLAEIRRVIRPGGRFVILESSKPENRIWRVFNGFYLQFILPYLGGIISGNLKAYTYLAKSSKNYYSRSEMGRILEDGGFTIVKSRGLFLGSVMLIVAEKQNKSTSK